MISDFFEENKPCPNEIPNCESLRAKYLEEIKNLDPRSCKPCVTNSIKNKFINFINSQK